VLTQDTFMIILLSFAVGGIIFSAAIYLQAREQGRRIRADLTSLRSLVTPEGSVGPGSDREPLADPMPADPRPPTQSGSGSAPDRPELAEALVAAIAGSDDATPARAVISGVQEEVEALADLCKNAVETEAQVLMAPLESYARRLEVALSMLREEGEAPPPPPDSDPPPPDDAPSQ
jgi:hypothetical protein